MGTAFNSRILELRQRLKKAEESFAINCYRFACEELDNEKEAGFPILDVVASRLSHNYRILLVNMSPERRDAALNDAIRWRYRVALNLLGMEAPSSQAEYLKESFEFCLQPPEGEAAKHGYLRPWDRPATKMKKPLLWRALKPEMLRVTGDRGESYPRGERLYKTVYGQWTVTTRLDAGGSSGGIRLAHDIWAARRHLDLARQLSLLSLLGFTFAAEWSQAGAEEEERVAKCVAIVCERFIGALPRLLKSVTHDISPEELAQFEEELLEDERRGRVQLKRARSDPGQRPRGPRLS